MRVIRLSNSMEDVARYMLGDGDADSLIQFLEVATNAVHEYYGRQYAKEPERQHDVFVSRITEGLSKDARDLLTKILAREE